MLLSTAAILGATASPVLGAGAATQPSICTRSCWNARSAGLNTNMASLNRAIIHHTAGSGDYNVSSLADSAAKVRAIQAFHMDTRGWSDIGYHFLVDKLGNTFEGRNGSMDKSTQRRGAHDNVNTNSFGFNVMGYYHPPENQTLTHASKTALYKVIAWRMPNGWSPYGSGYYGQGTVGYVDGHRTVGAQPGQSGTVCPGDGIFNTIITTNYNSGEARHEINDLIQGAPPPAAVKTSDICWYRPGTGIDSIWEGNANDTFTTGIEINVDGTYIPIVADFNGNGKDDILWYGPGTEPDRMWRGRGTHTGQNQDGWFVTGYDVAVGGTYVPLAGDFNGDGKGDILWYGPGDAPDTMWLGRSTPTTDENNPWFDLAQTVSIANTYDRPFVGDFNGDGKDDIVWYQTGTGSDTMWMGRATDSGSANGWFDTGKTINVNGTYKPVAGDFNGDGKDDILWYGPGAVSDSLWRGRGNSGGADSTNPWFDVGMYSVNVAGDDYAPIVGDFDGDNRWDILWYSSSGSDSLWRANGSNSTAQNGWFTTSSETVGSGYVPFAGKF